MAWKLAEGRARRRRLAWAVAVVTVVIVGTIGLLAIGWSERAARMLFPGGGATGPVRGPSEGSPPRDTPAATPGDAPARRRIGGRVLADGRPFAGARVALASPLTMAAGEPEAWLSSGLDGRFDFGQRPVEVDGEYVLVADAPGFSEARKLVDLRDPVAAPPPDRVELLLRPCVDSLTGKVFDAGGGPIAGAAVRLGEAVVAGGATTDGDGRYTLCVPSSSVDLRVDARGYGAVLRHLEVHGRVLVDIRLLPEAVLVGRTVREGDGAPVPRAIVAVSSSESGLEQRAPLSTISDESGRFRLAGVAAGSCQLRAWAGDLGTEIPVSLFAEPAKENPELVVRLSSMARVTGIVVEGEAPLPGALVSFRMPPRLSSSSRTDAAGGFLVDRVPRGVVRPSVRDCVVRAPEEIRIAASVVEGLRIEVKRRGTIAGRVLRGGAAAAGAEVSTSDHWNRVATETDAYGSYVLRGLSAGSFRVRAVGGSEDAFGVVEGVVLAEGENKTGIDVELRWGASIEGTVVDEAGQPIQYASVGFSGTTTADRGEGATSETGAFRAGSLRGGQSYRPSVRSASRPLEPADGNEFPPVAVPDGAAHVRGVKLVVGVGRERIGGVVVDDDGGPVADVRLYAQRAGALLPQWSRDQTYDPFHELDTVASNVDGQFVLDGLRRGTYSIHARASDGRDGTLDGVATGRTDAKIILPAAARIEGRIVGFPVAPDVTVLPVGRWEQRIYCRVDGDRFDVGHLRAGGWHVVASGQGGADAADVTLRPGDVARVTLTNRGESKLAGVYRDFETGAPLAGGSCFAGIASAGTTRVAQLLGPRPTTDAQGRFVLSPVPRGTLIVQCQSAAGSDYSTAIRIAEVGDAEQTDVELFSVRSSPGASVFALGLEPDWSASFLQYVLRGPKPGSPAAAAGLRAGDLIASVDGRDVSPIGTHSISYLLGAHAAGSTIRVVVLRGGAPVAASVPIARP